MRVGQIGALLGMTAALMAVFGVAGCTPYNYAVHGPSVSAGVAAEIACAGVFVSHRTLDDVVKNDVERLSPLTAMNSYRLDRAEQSVSVTALHLATRTAVYRPGIGCTLLVDSSAAALRRQAEGIPVPDVTPRPAPWPAGDAVDLANTPAGINRAALDKAVADSFSDDTPDKSIDTRAILVVYDGRIVAERYAPGFDKDTRFLGWSASKSVTATLVGTLVAAGTLKLDVPPPVPEWQDKADPRRAITLSQLLRMSSGLKFYEPYDPGSDSTKMLFERGDMAAYAASRPLIHPPGTVWSYSSGTANILSRLVFRAAGGTLKGLQAYAWQHLFAPAGMTSAVFEPDESGDFVGSSYLYLTARDWARFGQLYLNGGTLNGTRVVPQSWVDFVKTPAPADPAKGYGGQFWLNGLAKPGSAARQFPHLPADMFSAEGHNDEFVAIFPSRNVVIVRLGWTVVENAFNRDKHFAAILAALPKP
ncbi:MAG: serine hydrolase [Pseudomonadota bacterium]|nr:serine hydrolase [Pseudomonadota bacterium]